MVWTRLFAAVLGTEMAAVLGVITGFFAGLCVGAVAVDHLLARIRDARLVYIGLELAIGAWAIASIWLIPAAGPALAAALGASPPALLLGIAGFLLPTLLLLPATMAMGGTLVALEKLVAGSAHDTRLASGVYGANTAGAVAGAMAAVLVLMPALGLSGTLGAMAFINAVCAVLTYRLTSVADAPPALPATSPSDADGWRLDVTLVATGLLGVAFEVVVVRLAAQVLQDTVLSFALLLAAYLLGTAIGGLVWQRVGAASDGRAVHRLLIGSALACLATAGTVQLFGQAAVEAGPLMGPWEEMGVACGLFLLPTIATGALFGCLAQIVRDRQGTLGRAIAVNSAGAAAAPALAALFLIPAVGTWAGLLILGALYALLSLGWASRTRATLGLMPLAAAAALWLLPAPMLVRVPPGGQVLETQEGASATASVVQGGDGTRYLEVNGHFRMGGTRSIRSDWRQAHVPLLLHPAPRRALFLGVGTGATLAGARAIPDLDVMGVELTPEVAALLPWFAEAGTPPLPPLVIADARRFVVAATGAYDVIVADLFHPALDGTGALYTTEHFRAVRARLAEGGLFCQWLPLYQLDAPSLRAIIRSFLAVFPEGSGWLGNYSLQTPMLALCGADQVLRPVESALAARLGSGAARSAYARSGLSAAIDLLGLHLADAPDLRRFAGAGPLNTDDTPVVALSARHSVRALSAAPSSLLVTLIGALADDTGQTGPGLAAYRRARDRFLVAGAAIPEGLEGRSLVDAAAPGLIDAVRISPAFDPAYGPLMSMAQALARSDRAAARRLLQQVDEAAPNREEARRLLARLPP